MTPSELIILGRNNIRSDKFAAAAISYIYKAFGDIVRSKEIWPFSNKVNLGWQNSKGTEQDCLDAMNFLVRALEKYEKEIEEETSKDTLSGDDFIKKLRYLLNNISKEIKIVNNTSDNINATSNNVENEIDKLS